MTRGLFIRADAGPQLGTGHVMRMLALAEAWVERGGEVTFGGQVTPALLERITALGARFVELKSVDVESVITQARTAGASVMVADGYSYDLAFQRTIRAAGLRLMVVDDNGENAAYDADWVLNVNVHAAATMYPGRVGQALLGPSYALLRSQLRRATARARGPVVERVLLTMGGADPVDATGRLLHVLQGQAWGLSVLVGAANPRLAAYEAARRPGTELHFNVTDVTTVMSKADLAVAAAGGTVWELALLGVPSLVVSLADNQAVLARTLGELGAAAYLGDARATTDLATWAAQVDELVRDEARRSRLVQTARSLVDGKGALRVVDALWET